MTSQLIDLTTDTPWWRLETDEQELQTLEPRQAVRMLEQLLLIRRFEERLLNLSVLGVLHGPAHSSIGQDGAAVGALSLLNSQDKINGTHRMHHQFLAKALNHACPADYDPLQEDYPAAMQEVVMRTYAEILGLTPGYCGGRGGSMHLRYPEAGIYGSNAIVGGNPSHAVGYAFADKLRGRPDVSVAFFGDGATQSGACYEALNLAALYKTSTIFFIENNLYAVSTHVSEQTRETRLSARGLSLGVPAIEFDGMDVLAARAAMREALRVIQEQGGPVLLEARTYRYLHQSGAQKGSAFGYRAKDEEAQWAERDPMQVYPRQLMEAGLLDEAQYQALAAKMDAVLDIALDALVQDHAGKQPRIRAELWPRPETVDYGIRGDLSELNGLQALEQEDLSEAQRQSAKFVDVISAAMLRNMQRDDGIVIFGEDVHRLRGGTAGATRNIGEQYPDRLIGTPICENGFTGLALGAALNGLRPVVEIMYPDFSLVAADQLFNQVAKVRHMFGGEFPVPVLVRSRMSAGTGYGSQHSMDAAGLFALYPGWRIVAPSRPHDYIGLLNAALRCHDPVLIIEYQDLFRDTDDVPTQDWDYIVPFGKARIARSGSACTVLTYGNMVGMACQAAEASGVDAEIIDLRSLDVAGIDWECIEASVRRTQCLIVAEQTTRGTSIGSRLISDAQARLFDWLDHEIVHVTGSESSPVVSKVLEAAALANQDDLAQALIQVQRTRNPQWSPDYAKQD